ncbi:translation initiation factor IF-2 [Methylobacterium trifolii]|uniref:Translation initiation factor IF-2 n=1 Tax=Methylobacterium trifolii TaxID=1003092 RepID=A0ABQ4TY96_9HYPH|nr:translation initiation factor IF-2 [Methylobacterium trifolii]GJE59511.1 hypothetical protein MPOCJGCO_1604 [Methylobacterium trifolii]
MAVRVLALATVVALGLSGLAQAQRGPAPASGGAATQADPRPQGRSEDSRPEGSRAEPRAERGEPRAERSEPRAERAPRAERPRARAERRPPDYRSARYGGGRGASWRTGQDAYGFAGSYGGCRFRGHAGPNGYRLDRSC